MPPARERGRSRHPSSPLPGINVPPALPAKQTPTRPGRGDGGDDVLQSLRCRDPGRAHLWGVTSEDPRRSARPQATHGARRALAIERSALIRGPGGARNTRAGPDQLAPSPELPTRKPRQPAIDTAAEARRGGLRKLVARANDRLVDR